MDSAFSVVLLSSRASTRAASWMFAAVAGYYFAIWAIGAHNIKVGLFSFGFYMLTACGVRANSVLAALLAFCWELLGWIGDRILRIPVSLRSTLVLALIGAAVVLALAGRERPQDTSRSPEFDAEEYIDKNASTNSADTVARRVWRPVRWYFIALTTAAVVVCAIGTVQEVMRPGSSAALEDGAKTPDSTSR